MIKLGNFRAPKEEETQAAYFKAAVFKAVKGSRDYNESMINRFVTTVIGRTKTQDDYIKAYFYVLDRLKVAGTLHICPDELQKQAA